MTLQTRKYILNLTSIQQMKNLGPIRKHSMEPRTRGSLPHNVTCVCCVNLFSIMFKIISLFDL